MKHDVNYKPVINLTFVLLLFYCSSLLVLIPIRLFNIDVNNCSNLVYNLVSFFPNTVVVTILLLMYRKDLVKDFQDFKKNFGEYTDKAFKYWIIGFILMALSNYIIILFSPVKTATNENAVRSIVYSTPFIAYIFTCLVAPFLEELIFRKAFKDAIKTKWLFILTSGIVFGALHVVGSFESLHDLWFLAPYSFLGIAFACVYYDTDNIFSSIFIHFFHNTLVVLLALFELGVILWRNQEVKKI